MEQNLLTPSELADRWNLGVATLSQWRWNGRGPLFLKLGKRVMYRIEDIESFEGQTLYGSTSQYGKEA